MFPKRLQIAAFLLLLAFSTTDAQVYLPENDKGRGRDPDQLQQTLPRRWDLFVSAFAGYNDNILLVPDRSDFEGDPSATNLGLALDQSYRIEQLGEWRGEIDFSFYMTSNTSKNERAFLHHSDPGDYDLQGLRLRLSADRPVEIEGEQGNAGFAYALQRDWLPDSGFSTIHTLQGRIGIPVSPALRAAFSYDLSFESYDLVRQSPELDSRDGVRHVIGLTGNYRMGEERELWGGYRFVFCNTEGSNFDGSAHAITGRFRSPLYGPVWIQLAASLALESYDGFVASFLPPPGRTHQFVQDYEIAFAWPFPSGVTLGFLVDHTRYATNQQEFDASRTALAASISYHIGR